MDKLNDLGSGQISRFYSDWKRTRKKRQCDIRIGERTTFQYTLYAAEGFVEKGWLKSQMEIINQYWLNDNNFYRQVKSMEISSFLWLSARTCNLLNWSTETNNEIIDLSVIWNESDCKNVLNLVTWKSWESIEWFFNKIHKNHMMLQDSHPIFLSFFILI